METLLIVVALFGITLTYANLRNATVYCSVLMDLGVLSRGELRQRRNTLLRQALFVAGMIMALALATVPAAQLVEISALVRAAVLLLVAGLVFSQSFEQWSLRQCERLIEQDGGGWQR